MKIIKLSATNSTNSFLKELTQTSVLENYTIVTTENQFAGRGQQQNSWYSEPNKNLTMSVFIAFENLFIKHQKYLNFAVSLAIYKTLLAYRIPKLSIKWPNDILSANKKLCGILIENVIKNKKIQSSIIGIGINVHQEKFPHHLSNAISIKNCIQKEIDLAILLEEIIIKLKEKIELLTAHQFDVLQQQYLDVLYKKNIPSMFKDTENVMFMGIIKNISSDGKLQVALEDSSIKEFGVKEISFV
ncbi:MAG: biotin--[acetyl-CoA-carboxylase] ligase [Polaribacter sp.]